MVFSEGCADMVLLDGHRHQVWCSQRGCAASDCTERSLPSTHCIYGEHGALGGGNAWMHPRQPNKSILMWGIPGGIITLPYHSQRPDRPMFWVGQTPPSTLGTQLFPILDLDGSDFEFLTILDLILWPFWVENWSFSRPKIILLLSRSLTSYKNATWRIYCKLQYKIDVFDIAYRHIISTNHQISIPKSNFFLVSILDHFLITFGRQNVSNWPPNRPKSDHFRVRLSDFSWFVCRPCSKTVQNRPRRSKSDLFELQKWPFGVQKWPFGLQKWPFGWQKWPFGCPKWPFGLQKWTLVV